MADCLTICAALLVSIGFTFLFWFIRRLGIIETQTAVTHKRPKPQPMVEVCNPFKITASSLPLIGCVDMLLSCTHPCYVWCFWKVEKQCLDQIVCFRDSSDGKSEETDKFTNWKLKLEKNCKAVIGKDFTDICSGKKVSYNVTDLDSIEPDLTNNEIQVYDLVVAMELTDEHKAMIESESCITAMLAGIQLERQNGNFKTSIIQQYIQTYNGKIFKLQKLFLEGSSNHEQREEPNLDQENENEFSDVLKGMNPLEIVKRMCEAS
ncbi:uncharacterized protein LOC114532510 isoform X2 [Dendronephthya gigantea]|uniref:uncharacterized protein LOC114532510 isoform X2 n=1 Tax=Dendronephthya gigantea TaxID=151771 RepID=UPI00106D694A|nr:uncharacterized protein LOC114532510 isoform X2 [Dendronephthya gigantea]